ncbi:hypothetical protein AAFF_G00140140 [Aldrovandia affinis]|uniref:Tetratricopeptide repeat protein 27 n=1 Tax=Aldrovandia affinis TaxID=143900 RepID=A0AAD7X2W0_9TELE|nr:hypothetical protein AAFF_G00140140 [Aldrovandia affinis]
MVWDVEIAALRGFLTVSEATEWKQNHFNAAESGSLLESLLEGNFEGVLMSPAVLDILGGESNNGERIEAYLERHFLAYLTDATEDDKTEREMVLYVLAVACLHLFAQSNWTGPPVSVHTQDFLPPALLHPLSEPQALTVAILSSLVLDGESVYSLVSNPFLLILARVLLVSCGEKLESFQLLPWWTLRYVALHQQSSMERVLKSEALFTNETHRNLAIQFHLECGYTCLTYYEYRPAKEHFQQARELSRLDINVTGALGKRTRFQENFLAQLILDVQRQEGTPLPEGNLTHTPTPLEGLPKDHDLGDDTVLNNVRLAEPEEHQLPDLSAEEQAVILGVCTDFQKNNPVHKLTEEELLAFTSLPDSMSTNGTAKRERRQLTAVCFSNSVLRDA